MISEITLAMECKIGLGRIGGVTHPYPTRAENVKMCGDAYNSTKLTPGVKSLLRKINSVRR
jgi:hypothetical protein